MLYNYSKIMTFVKIIFFSYFVSKMFYISNTKNYLVTEGYGGQWAMTPTIGRQSVI